MNRSFILLCLFLLASAAAADDKRTLPHVHKHRITGLFMKERGQDLRNAVQKLRQVKLVSIDIDNAEAVFSYDPAKAFAGAKPEQIVERFNKLLKSVSKGTFGVKPLCRVPREKLQRIEIGVAGLDCKGCSYAAYLAIYQLEGVEQAMVSFHDGRATALIDPSKIDRAKLIAALKKRGVPIVAP
ncbi:MAG: heavy-metal-associated domain-containing protein [Gemmataceae bacterium]